MAPAVNTIELVDPELRPLLALFPTRQLSRANLEEARQRTLPIAPQAPKDVSFRETLIAGTGDAPDIPVRIYKPATDEPLPCIFHMHGGGFVMGSAKEMAAVHIAIASEIRCAIVSVDYRLAPETPFPGNIEDCYAALAWTFAKASAEGIDTARIGVMGESAGGGLAASLALMARDRGEFPLAFQHLIYPMLDDRTCTLPPPTPRPASSSGMPTTTISAGRPCWGIRPGFRPSQPMPRQREQKILRGCRPLSSAPEPSISSWTKMSTMRAG